MKKISLLTVALIAVLAICVGTASAQTASVGYKGIMASGAYGDDDDFMALNGLSFRGWVDNIGWEGTLFFGRDNYEQKRSYDDYNWERDSDMWAIQLQGMYAIITNENSKLYVGLNASYGRSNTETHASYQGNYNYDSYEYDTDYWTAGPLIGAQYSFQGIPELTFCWDLGYTFMLSDTDYTNDNYYYKGYDYQYEYDNDIDGINVSLGVHYAF